MKRKYLIYSICTLMLIGCINSEDKDLPLLSIYNGNCEGIRFIEDTFNFEDNSLTVQVFFDNDKQLRGFKKDTGLISSILGGDLLSITSLEYAGDTSWRKMIRKFPPEFDLSAYYKSLPKKSFIEYPITILYSKNDILYIADTVLSISYWEVFDDQHGTLY